MRCCRRVHKCKKRSGVNLRCFLPNFPAFIIFGNKPLKQVARDLGICVTSLRRWRDRALGGSGGNGPGAVGDEAVPAASAKELWDENQRLRRENEYLRRQREILKKAASILAEDPQLGMR